MTAPQYYPPQQQPGYPQPQQPVWPSQQPPAPVQQFPQQQGYYPQQGYPQQPQGYGAPQQWGQQPPPVELAQGGLDDFYSQPRGSSGEALSFKQIASHAMVVNRPLTDGDVRQQTAPKDKGGAPLFFKNGKPKWVLLVPVNVSPQYSQVQEGKAVWFCQGGAYDDLAKAMVLVGKPEGPPEPGSFIYVAKLGMEQVQGGGSKNVWDIRYVRPGSEAQQLAAQYGIQYPDLSNPQAPPAAQAPATPPPAPQAPPVAPAPQMQGYPQQQQPPAPQMQGYPQQQQPPAPQMQGYQQPPQGYQQAPAPQMAPPPQAPQAPMQPPAPQMAPAPPQVPAQQQAPAAPPTAPIPAQAPPPAGDTNGLPQDKANLLNQLTNPQPQGQQAPAPVGG